jgi:hypothetical protein
MRSASCAKRWSNGCLGWSGWVRGITGSPDGSGGSVQHSLSPMDADTDAVMGHSPTSGSGASGQYCSRLKTIERTPRLVSNPEQPITTLKSRMKLSPPNHKGAVFRSAFSKEAHCKNRNHHFGRIKMTPRRARLSFSRKLVPGEQRRTIQKISRSLFKAGLRTQCFLSRLAG